MNTEPQRQKLDIPLVYAAQTNVRPQQYPSESLVLCLRAYAEALTQNTRQYSLFADPLLDFCAATRVLKQGMMEILAPFKEANLKNLGQDDFIALSSAQAITSAKKSLPENAPILLEFFHQLKNIKYVAISAGAVALDGAQTSERIEPKYPEIAVSRILAATPPDTDGNLAVNLPNAGFIVAASSLEFLERQVNRICPTHALHL